MHLYVIARRILCLAFAATGAACVHTADIIRPMREDPRLLGDSYPKPAWRLPLRDQEVDIFAWIGDQRLLVGTLSAGQSLYLFEAFRPAQLHAIDASSGKSLWSFDRASVGEGSQSLLSIGGGLALLQVLRDDRVSIIAIDLGTGAKRWLRDFKEPETFVALEGGTLAAVHQSRKKLEVVALRLADGGNLWELDVEGYPRAEQRPPRAVGDAGDLLLLGANVTRLDGRSGAVRWRVPFPGAYQPDNGALLLAEGLLFTDGGGGVALVDRASGATRWRDPGASGGIGMVGVAGERVLVERKSSPAAPGSVRALDLATGRLAWSAGLSGPVRSPFLKWNEAIAFTTPTEVVALSANGSALFRAALPEDLECAECLPDVLDAAAGRLVVGRELGVAAVERDGRIAFSHAIAGTLPFTTPYHARRSALAMHKIAGREKSKGVGLAFVPQTSAAASLTAAQANYTAMSAAVRSRSSAFSGSSSSASLAASRAEVGAQMARMEAQINAAVQFAGAIVGAAQAFVGWEWQQRMQISLENLSLSLRAASLTHARAIGAGRYVRPFYRAGHWLAVVDLATGARTDVHLSPRLAPLDVGGLSLPAFSTDPAGRLLAKGIGGEVASYDPYVAKMWDVQYTVKEWTLPRPSLFAFDLASLPRSGTAPAAVKGAGAYVPDRPGSIRSIPAGADRALLDAIVARDPKRVEALLKQGADANAVDETGITALMYASLLWEDESVEKLLEAGADVAASDPMGRTAWIYAQTIVEGYDVHAGARWGRTVRALLKAWDRWKERDAARAASSP